MTQHMVTTNAIRTAASRVTPEMADAAITKPATNIEPGDYVQRGDDWIAVADAATVYVPDIDMDVTIVTCEDGKRWPLDAVATVTVAVEVPEKRQAVYARLLRELADRIEAAPDMPMPHYSLTLSGAMSTVEDLRAIGEALGIAVESDYAAERIHSDYAAERIHHAVELEIRSAGEYDPSVNLRLSKVENVTAPDTALVEARRSVREMEQRTAERNADGASKPVTETPAPLPVDVDGHPIRGPHTLQQLGEPCRPACKHDPACVDTCADFDNGTGAPDDAR